jgi:hypothetical protein
MSEVTVTADNCVIYGKWPEKDRWALRQMIGTVPLGDEPICDECLMAFWESCWGEQEHRDPRSISRSMFGTRPKFSEDSQIRVGCRGSSLVASISSAERRGKLNH